MRSSYLKFSGSIDNDYDLRVSRDLGKSDITFMLDERKVSTSHTICNNF